MKFPKLRGLFTAATTVGEAKARALEATDVPYLRSRGPGYTARKRGQFTEVIADEPDVLSPVKLGFLWMVRLEGATLAGLVTRVRLAKPGAASQKDQTVLPAAPTPEYWGINGGLYVGAGRIAALTEQGTDWGNTQVRASAFTRTVSVRDAPGTSRAWIYNQVDGLASCMFATGWDDVRKAYRWGFVAKYAPFSAAGLAMSVVTSTTEQPTEAHVYLSDTAGSTPTHIVPPNDGATRVHFGARMYVTGPGQLTGLVFIKAHADFVPPASYALDVRQPYFLHSADHGETWTQIDASFLSPMIPKLTQAGAPPPGEYPDPQSAAYSATYSGFVYLGSGRSLFIFRHYASTARTDAYAKCYFFEAGVFTPLAWGYDASLDAVAFPALTRSFRGSVGAFEATGLIASDASSPASFCFGPGCCVVPTTRGVIFSTATCVLRITRDYGATWSEVTLPATMDGVSGLTPIIVPAAPYVSSDSPGRIYLIYRAKTDTSNTRRCYKTDGNFAAFADMGTVVDGASGRWADLAVWAPGKRPLCPQLPDEFNPP